MRILLILLLLLGQSGWALDVQSLVAKAIEREESMRAARQKYTHHLVLHIEKLDRAGQVLATRHVDVKVQPDRNLVFSTDLQPEDRENQSRKVRDSQKMMAVMDFRKLAPRFNLSLDGREDVYGRPCHRIRFAPKENQPYQSREEKIINAMTGTFWVDEETLDILKSEGNLSHPVSVAWFFATAREVKFLYQSTILPNGEVVPASFDLLYDIQATVAYQRWRHQSKMDNYEKKSL